ncbi:MAG: AAA family ATPase [Paraglaciecola sp.]|uniref:AAA family ATPase n=1 Tax=Paraglaciecola sp. TaxID=1920173 RepID=UPI003299EE85
MNEPIIETTKRRSFNLKNLYLDPNNYRFVDNDGYIEVPESDLFDENIQKRSSTFIEGNKRSNIKDLIASFKSNGFLDVDVIQVRDLGQNRYLVIEGNRRVASLKALQEDHENGLSIGNLNPEIFKKIPFEIHSNESKEKHLIIMGLKHISGNKKWSAINQAQLIYDFLKPYWNSYEYTTKENQLCDSLGITKIKLRSSQRAYHLIIQYRNSDFGDQFESKDYSFFVEIMKRPKIKDWLDWDEQGYICNNTTNMQRLFSWFSITEELVDEEYEEYEELDPIITKALEIRELALFINNEAALTEMEKTRSIIRGLMASGEVDKLNYEKSLTEFSNSFNELSSYKNMVQYEDIETLENIKAKLNEFVPQKSYLEINHGNHSVAFEHDSSSSHFKSLLVNQYKIFNKFNIDNLKRVNIFAGFNNSGKTTLLEALYYLTKQNDVGSFLEIIKLKNKLKLLNPIWLNEVFDENEVIDVQGIFNNANTSVQFTKFEASNINKSDDYIASYLLKAKLNERELTNTIHTFGYDTLNRENEKVEHLCKSIFKSPYFYNSDELVETYNKNTINKDSSGQTAISLVVKFLKKVDNSINDIRLNEVDDIQRFIVDSTKFKDKNIEITNYGEGLQRIFEIALSFASARNGVVCLDEFETAIHNSILIEFTKFVQELADTFNVQVFLTSHSKECIDAFVNNDYRNDEISTYFIENNNGTVEAVHVDGTELKEYIDTIDFDLRGKSHE